MGSLTVVVRKSYIFRNIKPCSPLNRRFRSTCRLRLQGRRISQARNQYEADSMQSRSTLGMEATYSSELSADCQRVTRRYIRQTVPLLSRAGSFITLFRTNLVGSLLILFCHLRYVSSVKFCGHDCYELSLPPCVLHFPAISSFFI
jgi:hypothetical protein